MISVDDTLDQHISKLEPDWKPLGVLALEDVLTLQVKDKAYGSSWKKRGGVGAFMMLARKWDRIETALRVEIPGTFETEYRSIFTIGVQDTRKEDILEDIADLRRYLLLVEGEIRLRRVSKKVGNGG